MNSAVGVGSGRRALPSDSLSIASSRSEYGSVVLRPKTKPKGSTTRRISCKDLGQGDCQGWLYRKRSTAITTLWVKRWCVIKNNSLYYYRYIEDQHAEGLINLRGFVISPVAEIKSGRYAFRIYNDYNTITFASESEQDRSKWMNKLGLAAIGYDTSRLQQMGGFAPGFVSPPPNPSVTNGFSESDDSSDDGTGPPVELRGSSSASSSTSSSSNSAVQMAQRVSSFYPELSTIDEEERRHSSLVRTLREVKRMERIITDKKQQVQLIDDFLKDPANITSDILRQFMQEYAYIFNND